MFEKNRALIALMTDKSEDKIVAKSLWMRYSPGGVVILESHFEKLLSL